MAVAAGSAHAAGAAGCVGGRLQQPSSAAVFSSRRSWATRPPSSARPERSTPAEITLRRHRVAGGTHRRTASHPRALGLTCLNKPEPAGSLSLDVPHAYCLLSPASLDAVRGPSRPPSSPAAWASKFPRYCTFTPDPGTLHHYTCFCPQRADGLSPPIHTSWRIHCEKDCNHRTPHAALPRRQSPPSSAIHEAAPRLLYTPPCLHGSPQSHSP
jgi:hypothetical protein